MKIAMLGSSFIARLYAESLHAKRRKDRAVTVYSLSDENPKRLADDYILPCYTSSMEQSIVHPEVDVVLIELANHLH